MAEFENTVAGASAGSAKETPSMPDSALESRWDRDDEVDLRPYFEMILRRYRLIIGITLAATLLGLGIGIAQPKSYEAQAVVAVTAPLFLLNSDPLSRSAQGQNPTESPVQMARSMISLAADDEILRTLISAGFAASPRGAMSIDDLRQILHVATGSDPGLVVLTARTQDPRQSAALANAWADALVLHAQSVFHGNASDLTFLDSSAKTASTNLSKAESALVDFEAHSQMNVLTSRLDVLKKDQQAYLADREGINRVSADVRGLRAHLGQYAPTAKVSFSDDLTALLLETKAFNASVAVPVQLQVNSADGVSTKTAGELQGVLDDLEAQLSRRSDSDQARIDQMTPQIMQLQGQVQQITSDGNRLTAERDSAKGLYQTLVQQADAGRIAMQNASNQIRIASHASVPTQSLPSHLGTFGAVAGVVGLLVGLLLALVLGSRRPRDQASTTMVPRPRSSPTPVIAGADGASDQ